MNGPATVLIPGDADWLAAGEPAGLAMHTIAGGGRISTAFDRVELISDALTVTPAAVTEDAGFDVLAQLVPGLRVLFYCRMR